MVVMEKIPFAVLVLGLLVLDFAALDDITTNIQPNYVLEYGMLVVSLLIFILLGLNFKKLPNKFFK